MKKKIIEFLQGPRIYAEGLALYNEYGWNVHLKKSLTRIGETESNMKILIEELRKLAGLSEKDFRQLKRYSKKNVTEITPLSSQKYSDDILLDLAEKFNVSVDELVSDEFAFRVCELEDNDDKIEELEAELDDAREKYKAAPEPVIKMIRFRERFTFLNHPDCPDIFKILVTDLFVSYDKYQIAYLKLQEFPADIATVDSAKLAEEVVEQYLNNREMWEELEHYQENKVILGKCAKMKKLLKSAEISQLSDIDLTVALNNARANLSKSKKKIQTATTEEKKEEAKALTDKWEIMRTDLTAEFESRKKK